MKRILIFLGLFFLLSLGWSKPNVEGLPKRITIGLNPGGSPANLQTQSVEFGRQLQVELGVPISIFIPKNYEGLIEAMKNKKVDYAFFSAMSFVSAEQRANAKVLLKKVYSEPFYYSALITREDTKIKDLGQLKGKKIVFVDKQSASGFLYPYVMLRKKGIDLKDFSQVLYSGNHSQSIQMLENREIDVAAVFSDDPKGQHGAWVKFAGQANTKYHILWMSEPIPNDPFAVRKDFYDEYPKFTHNLMMTLIDLFEKNKSSKIFEEILGHQDLMPATSRQYDPVREMVKSLSLQ